MKIKKMKEEVVSAKLPTRMVRMGMGKKSAGISTKVAKIKKKKPVVKY